MSLSVSITCLTLSFTKLIHNSFIFSMKSKGLKVTEFKVFPHFRSPQHHEDKLQPNKEDAETNSKGIMLF